MKIPVRLQRDPIVECIAQISFQPKMVEAGDLLPGLLYSDLREQFGTIQRQPAADVPRPIRNQNQAFLNQPLHNLIGNRRSVLIGDRFVAVAVLMPYPGWTSFEPTLIQVIGVLESTNLVGRLERISLKYRNLVPGPPDEDQYSKLNAELRLADFNLRPSGKFVRAELDYEDSIFVVDIKSGAQAIIDNVAQDGTLVEVDGMTALAEGARFSELQQQFHTLHHREKMVFFSLLKEGTIDEMGPVWE